MSFSVKQAVLTGPSLVLVCLVSCSTQSDERRSSEEVLARGAQALSDPIVPTKVCQLTGQTDRGIAGSAGLTTGMVRGTPGDGAATAAGGITGTDIGWSFEHAGRLHFMFGDTRDYNNIDACDPGACGFGDNPQPAAPAPNGGTLLRWANAGAYWDWQDQRGESPESWASAAAGSNPANCFSLEVPIDPSTGRFRQTKYNQRILYRQEGGFSGFSDGSNVFGFFTLKSNPKGCQTDPDDAQGCSHDGAKPGGKTILARSTDGGARFFDQVTFSSTKFQFVAPTVLNSGPAGLPPALVGKPVVMAFGGGRTVIDSSTGAMTEFHKGLPYLAVAPLAEVGKKWSYTLQYPVTWAPEGGSVSTGSGFSSGSAAIANREDSKWLFSNNSQIYTILTNGDVLAQDIGSVVSPTYQIPRDPWQSYANTSVATRPEDKWVVYDKNRGRILVIKENGELWAHALGTYIGAAYRVSAWPPVAAQPEDNHVLAIGDYLYVITKRGRVFAHRLFDYSVNTAFELETPTLDVAGALPPESPKEHFVFAANGRIVRVTKTGRVFSHNVFPTANPPRVDAGVELTLSPGLRIGTAAQDLRLLPVVNGTSWRFIVLPYYLYSWYFFTGFDSYGAPTWTSPTYQDDSGATPIRPWDDGPTGANARFHNCFGYFSVRYVPVLAKWVMLYGCSDRVDEWGIVRTERGTYVRSSATPWGPWSDPQRIDVPGAGYCNFMHLRDATCTPNPNENSKREVVTLQDGSQLAVPEFGGDYAPFLLPGNYQQYLAPGRMNLFFTVSTWNPYQTVLLRADVSNL